MGSVGGGRIPQHATTARVSKERSHNCDGDPGKGFRSLLHLCLEGVPYRVRKRRGEQGGGKGGRPAEGQASVLYSAGALSRRCSIECLVLGEA